MYSFCIYPLYWPTHKLAVYLHHKSETPALDSEVETREDEKTEKLENDAREMKGLKRWLS